MDLDISSEESARDQARSSTDDTVQIAPSLPHVIDRSKRHVQSKVVRLALDRSRLELRRCSVRLHHRGLQAQLIRALCCRHKRMDRVENHLESHWEIWSLPNH